MPERAQLERTFIEHIPAIDRLVGAICRRYGVPRDDADDVAAWIKARFVEDGYAALARFRGESSITTYLAVVVALHFRDYRAQRWGRWRPSAAAQRQGATAVRLETLVLRDQVPLRQAAELLRTSGETTLSDRDLARLLAALPARGPLRPVEVGAEPLAFLEAPDWTDEHLEAQAAAEERKRVLGLLDAAMSELPAEDGVILRLRFWEDMSVADIARTLGLEQKPLYRRVERSVAALRERLASEGLSAQALECLTESPPEAAAIPGGRVHPKRVSDEGGNPN